MLLNPPSFFSLYLLTVLSIGALGSCYNPSFNHELSQCGNGQLDEDEQCDDGLNNGLYGYCNMDCSGPGPSCGDGQLDENEQCDDGSNNGSYGFCNADCSALGSSCGNGMIEESEVCDDGENNGSNGFCNADCSGLILYCGNGQKDEGEQCDDGSNNGSYGFCNTDCSALGPFCGDGDIEVEEEQCDDGSNNGSYGFCNADCSALGPSCGDGQLDENEQCDDGSNNGSYGFCSVDCSGLGPHCGNGITEETEQCDDGNEIDEDICNTSCESSCGNGILEVSLGEECDNGPNNADTSACTRSCLLNICSDGLLFAGVEACDDGNVNNQDACLDDCTAANCGDGYIQEGVEECEDGNNVNGDGCENNCKKTVKEVSAGRIHTCALIKDGKIRCWGYGSGGRLGYGNQKDIGDDETPASASDVDVGGTVFQIAAGGAHTCALLDSGSIRCWGANAIGQLGYGNMSPIGDDETPASNPKGGIDIGGNILQITAGNEHTCALLDTGNVRCWGNGNYGRLGYGKTDSIGDDETPASAGDVDVGETVLQITAGEAHTCALLDQGRVRCWGRNNFGQLGYGNTSNIGDNLGEMPPGDVSVGGTVIQIVAGDEHTCALLDSGSIRCWGYGTLGRLGYGNTSNIGDNPGEMPPGDVPVGEKVIQITTGIVHTCALLEQGKIRCWGYGTLGRLGYGNTNSIGDNETPASQDYINVGGTVLHITAGGSHTCALLNLGRVRCWGEGFLGRLGYGNTSHIGDDEFPSSVGPVPLF